jgi:hypothetical protein
VSRSMIVALALSTCAVALAPSVAHAQEEVCSGALTHAQWKEGMDAADKQLAAFDVPGAARILEEVKKQVPCLDTIAKPSHLGRFARQMALIAFFEQDEITSVKWGMLQQYAAPSLPWPADLGEDHAFREMLAFADAPSLAGPDDKGLVFPKKGAVFMNGALLERPKARAEVPNLMQIADKSGLITLAYWQDGAAFRDDILAPTAETEVAIAPKWFVPEDPAAMAASAALFGTSDGLADRGAGTPAPAPAPVTAPAPAPAPVPVAVAQPSPAPAPVPVAVVEPEPVRKDGGGGVRLPQLLAGGGLGVVAGSLYTVGFVMRGGLGEATTEDELIAARSRVNLMAIGAGVAAVAGVGVGVTAFVSADGGGLGWTIQH